jgi:hypothetical protein
VTVSDDFLSVFQEIIGAFVTLYIPYFVTGSFASSVHGEPRATNDLDIVAELDPDRAAALVAALDANFVGDTEQARAALHSGHGFNLIDRRAYLKVDVFPLLSDLDRSALKRAEPVRLPGSDIFFRSATKEDILLAKLIWYRQGDWFVRTSSNGQTTRPCGIYWTVSHVGHEFSQGLRFLISLFAKCMATYTLTRWSRC